MAPIARTTEARRGTVRGQPKRFIRGHNAKRFNGAPARITSARYRERHPDRIKATQRKHKTKKYAALAALKKGPCLDCGGYFPPECMDFDHVRGVKSKGVSQFRSHKIARLLEEVEKCDLLCSNCHRIRTFARKRLKVSA